MAFSISDFDDLKRLLGQHPEWRAELRHLLLDEDFEALPGIVRELAEAQRRTEQRVAELAEGQRQLAQKVAELAEGQRQLAQKVAELAEGQRQLAQKVVEIAEGLRHLEQKVAEIAEGLRHLEQKVAELAEAMRLVVIRLGRVEGRTLEIEYREKAPGYFATWLRRTRVAARDDLEEAIDDRLTPEELRDVLLADLVVRGRLRPEGNREIWLAVEVSVVVDRDDVARALRRAELLRRAGLPALPAVAGESATEGALAEAENRGVAMLRDGRDFFWDTALATWSV